MLAIGTILAVAAWFLTESLVERDARHRFQATTTAIAANAQSSIRSYADLLNGLGGLFEADPAVSRAGFNSYVHSLDLPLHYPGVRSISYVQHLRAPATAKFEKELSSDPELARRGYRNVVIKPAGERAEYFVIKYIEPLHANRAALGFDVGSDPARIPLIELARDSGMPTLSGRIALVSEPTRSAIGVVLRLALYRKDALVPDVERRREAFAGLLNVTFLVEELAQRMLAGEGKEQVTLSIHDAGPVGNSAQSTAVEIFSNAALGPSQTSAVLTDSRYIDVGQRRWELKFSAPQGPFMRDTDHVLPWAAFSALLAVSLLLSGLIRSLANSRQRAKTLAEKMTADLSESHARLAEEKRRTTELIEVLPNPNYFKGTDGRYLGVNRAWEAYFGTPRDEIIGKTVHDLYPDNPELANKLQADDQAVWDNPGSRSYETTITTRDGRPHEAIFYKATFTHADGRIAGLIGTIVDISERKQAEAARARLAAIVENSNDAIFSRALDGTILSWNAGAERMLGFTAAETIGKPIAMTLPPDRPPNLAKNNEELLRGKNIARESNRMTKDGRVIDVLTSHSPIRNNAGDIIGASVILQDITALKQAQAARAQLAAIVENSNDAIIGRDSERKILSWNAAAERLFGYTASEVIGRHVSLIIPPGHEQSAAHIRERLAQGHHVHDFETERVAKSGRLIPVSLTLSPIRDAQGAVAGASLIVRDISARKQAEAATKAAEDRFRAMFNSAAVGITCIDLDGMLVDVNQKFCDIVGYARDELIGKAVKDITHPEDYGNGAALRSQVTRGAIQQAMGEKRFFRKDGAVIWARRTMSIARDSAGNPQYAISVVEDITDSKHAQMRQAMEHAVTRLLSEADRSSGVVSKVIGIIGEAFDCACGAYLSKDKHEQFLECTDIWSEPSAKIMEFAGSNREFKHPIHLAGKLSTRAWNSGEPVWIDDLTRVTELERAPLALNAGLRGAFAFPIRSGNETVGVMEFFSRASRPPDEALLQSTRALGNQIGLFMARKEAEERLRHLAHYDELTGLANRSMCGERLNHALAQAQRHHKLLTVLFVDLDRFKHINDTLGHEAGDRVLKEVSQRLLGCVRASDTVGRLGGDEFVVLLEELIQPLHVGAIAQKILDAVAKPYSLDTQECHLSASVGISSYPADGETMQSLLKNADIAMYRAKEQGKNNFQYYSAQMNAHSLERMEMESDLRHALERNELLLHYQPKINEASGQITGMEALLRWQHPTRGLIPPARFIPLAEENGLIVPIGAWVLRTACTQNKAWQEQGLPPLRVAVNLSARQFFHENLLQDVSDIFDETGLNPAMLEFEITESMMMHDPAHAVKLLTEIKALGVHLSIDDFGTGYSSLSYLKSFPIDSVKIDRSFIHGLPDDKNDVAITGAIIAMARSLNLNVIAEGVETVGQVRFLRHHGCNDMQGYYFGKPVPAHEFAQLMLDHAASETLQ